MSASTRSIPPDVGSPGILIVEDEQVTALDLHNRLRTLGYHVTAVTSSGEDALASINERRPDLVLMDIVLDGKITGTQTADVINQRTGIPVVYLTAYSDPLILDQVKKTDCRGFLRKPFQPETLHAVIQLALAQHQKDQVRKESERDAFQNFALECKEQLDQFAYTAGHDLREPLRTAGAFVELLARRAGAKLDQEELELLALAKDGMARLNILLEDLVAYAQAGSSSTVSHSNTSSTLAVEGALANLQDAIAETGAVINYDGLPVVSAESRAALASLSKLA